MEWAEESLFSSLPSERGERVGSARWVNSLGGRTFTPENPAWGVPNIAPVQKAAGLRKPGTQSGTFRSIIHTHIQEQSIRKV